jgi:hypothetical protein
MTSSLACLGRNCGTWAVGHDPISYWAERARVGSDRAVRLGNYTLGQAKRNQSASAMAPLCFLITPFIP